METSFPPDTFRLPERIILAADIGLDRASYEALEQAMVELLEDESHALFIRLLMAQDLVGAAVAEYGRGMKTTTSFGNWIVEMKSAGGRRWLLKEAINRGPGRPARQRLGLAPLIGLWETQREPNLAAQRARVIPLGTLIALAKWNGKLRVSSLSADVALEEMRGVWLDENSPELSSVLIDRLVSWLQRRILLRHPSVWRGTQYLLLCTALMRWYAAVAALANERSEVGKEALAAAAETVEREYVWGSAPGALFAGRRGLAALYSTMLDLLVSPADLAHNPFARYQHMSNVV